MCAYAHAKSRRNVLAALIAHLSTQLCCGHSAALVREILYVVPPCVTRYARSRLTPCECDTCVMCHAGSRYMLRYICGPFSLVFAPRVVHI